MIFPICDSIPVLLLGPLSGLGLRTAESFGYEWTRFPVLFGAYRENFLNYIHPLSEESFPYKAVLDAGCGNGRHSYWAARFGARDVVAMDVSDAVFAARRNTADLPNVHVIRGDIMHPPLKPRVFDLALSIGVLHHLPDPQRGFGILASHIRKGGIFAIWVYGRAHNFSNVYIYETLRIVTRRIPHAILHSLSYIPALGVHIANILHDFLVQVPFLRGFASRMPFSYYARFPFYVKVNDAFDVFSAPRSTYWLKEDIKSWYAGAGFSGVSVSFLRKKGIKAFGSMR